MRRVVDLHHQTYTAKEVVYEEKFKCRCDPCEQFHRLQMFHESGVKELASERAALASRAAAIEAADRIREQEK